VGLIRVNHSGARMDGPTSEDSNHPANVSEVVDHIQQLKKERLGVIGMKLCGGGQFEHSHDDRVKAMRFAFQNAGVDAVTVGFKSTQEIDEAISNLNLALA
jgi:methylmalonyl-CoA mutase cobalamin-binding subunit